MESGEVGRIGMTGQGRRIDVIQYVRVLEQRLKRMRVTRRVTQRDIRDETLLCYVLTLLTMFDWPTSQRHIIP